MTKGDRVQAVKNIRYPWYVHRVASDDIPPEVKAGSAGTIIRWCNRDQLVVRFDGNRRHQVVSRWLVKPLGVVERLAEIARRA